MKCKKCGKEAGHTAFIRKKNKWNANCDMEIRLPKKYCDECRVKSVKILYECSHDYKRKLNHHFDYNRPAEVIRLCPKCHAKEHDRLRKIGAQPPIGSGDSRNIKIPKTILGYDKHKQKVYRVFKT